MDKRLFLFIWLFYFKGYDNNMIINVEKLKFYRKNIIKLKNRFVYK